MVTWLDVTWLDITGTLLGHMLDLYNIIWPKGSGLEYTSGHQFNGTKINHWILGT
jgi:hypothetical protein